VEAAHLACAQKKAQREDRLIVFIDETDISERPTRVRTWAPRGQTPVIQFHFNWNHVSVIAGLSRTNYLFRLYEGSVNKEQVVEFLKALKAHLKQPLLIIWDGARLSGFPRRTYSHDLPAALLSRAQSRRVSVGMAQASCDCELLP
jgi:hypothetical protein